MEYKIKELLSSIVDNRGKTPPLANDGYILIEINAIASKKKNPDYSLIKKKVSKEVYDSWFRSGHPQKGDILIPTVGTLDAIGYMDRNDCCIAQNLIAFRTNPKICHSEYLFYLLCDPNIRKRLLNLDIGGVQPSIKVPHLKDLKVNIPPLDIQHRISTVLSSLDSKIAVNTAINENLHQLIAAYYAEIFKECEHTAKISDYADKVFSGGTPTTSNESYWSGEFKWLSSGETSQKYIVDTEKTITQAGVDNSSTRLAKKYDTVIASAGQGHTRGQTSMLLTDTYINQSIIVVESERIYMPFIYWNICGRYEELRVISNSNSIRGSLTTKMISAFTAPKADITQISRFSELAWAAIHEIEKNCNEIARLAALRDTLLPKLMNGEIDVSKVKL